MNNNSGLVKKLKDFCNSCNLSQLIKDYTRVTAQSQSIIDLILASDDDKISQYGVIDTGISDHCMVYCTRKVKRDQIGKHNNVKLRSLKGYSKTELLDRLSKVSWSCVLDCDDVNIAWNNFRTVFVNIIDSIAPLKETRLKQRSEPWIDDTILTNIKNRDQLFRNSKNTKITPNLTNSKKLVTTHKG